MATKIVDSVRGFSRVPLTKRERLTEASQRQLELRCFFTRPFGHRWDHPFGDKRAIYAIYDGGMEGPAIGTIRTCQDCGLRQKRLSSTPSHTDYHWFRLRADEG